MTYVTLPLGRAGGRLLGMNKDEAFRLVEILLMELDREGVLSWAAGIRKMAQYHKDLAAEYEKGAEILERSVEREGVQG